MRAYREQRFENGVLVSEERRIVDVVKAFYRGPWRKFMILSQDGMDELQERLADRTLGMQAVRVLFACIGEMNRDNECRAGRKDLAHRLEMAESNVAKALKDLVEAGFLERPRLKFSPYVVSPRLAWNSSTARLREALAMRGLLDDKGMMKSKEAA